MRPNILYLHTHDAGRYIEPYGHAVRTPNLMRLAREGIVFRNMHCAAPTCTPSRVAMLTGRAPHTLNVLGLAHRGWSLKRTDLHLATFLRESGYTTTLTGTQHEHTDPSALGYERILAPSWKSTKHRPATTEEAAASFIQENHERPFFLSVGFNTTHRTFPSPLPADDERYCRPPDPLPDNAATRRDMACYRRSVTILDEQMGRVLQALDDAGLREETLVICTTDHGIAFPMMKCTCTDHGTGVFFMLRWPGHVPAGTVTDALASHVDLFPTLCEWLELPAPAGLQGASLLPVINSPPTAEVNDAVFSEVTFHAGVEPMRAVRTQDWLYVRRYGDRLRPNGANIDVSYTRDYLVGRGFADLTYSPEELYDCVFDPQQRANLASDPRRAATLRDLRARLDNWMASTEDPLASGIDALPDPIVTSDPDDFCSPIGGPQPPPLPALYQRPSEGTH